MARLLKCGGGPYFRNCQEYISSKQVLSMQCVHIGNARSWEQRRPKQSEKEGASRDTAGSIGPSVHRTHRSKRVVFLILNTHVFDVGRNYASMERACKPTHKCLSQVWTSAEPTMLPLKHLDRIPIRMCCIMRIWYSRAASEWAAFFHLYHVGVQKSENVLSTTVAMVVIMDTRLIAW